MGTDDKDHTVTRGEYDRLVKQGGEVVPRGLAVPRPRKKAKKQQPGRKAQGFRCRACSEPSTSLAAAERHASETGHARIECV